MANVCNGSGAGTDCESLTCTDNQIESNDYSELDSASIISDLFQANNCTTSASASYEMAASNKSSWAVPIDAEISASGSAAYNRSGCEALQSIANTQQTFNQASSCVVDQTYAYTATTNSVTQTVSITTNNVIFNGPFDLSSFVQSDFISQTQFTATSELQIEQVLNTMLTTISDQTSEVETGWGAFASANKLAASTDQLIDQAIDADIVSSAITDTVTNNHVSENIVMVFENTTFNQRFAVDLNQQTFTASSNYTAKQLALLLAQDGIADIYSQFVQDSTTLDKGADSLITAWFEGIAGVIGGIATIAIIGLLALVFMGKVTGDKAKKMLKASIGLGALLIAGGITGIVLGQTEDSTILTIIGAVLIVVGIISLSMGIYKLKKDERAEKLDMQEQKSREAEMQARQAEAEERQVRPATERLPEYGSPSADTVATTEAPPPAYDAGQPGQGYQ